MLLANGGGHDSTQSHTASAPSKPLTWVEVLVLPAHPDTALSSASSASEVTISMRHTCLLAQLETIELAPERHGTASS
jgi:hypothetical protein